MKFCFHSSGRPSQGFRGESQFSLAAEWRLDWRGQDWRQGHSLSGWRSVQSGEGGIWTKVVALWKEIAELLVCRSSGVRGGSAQGAGALHTQWSLRGQRPIRGDPFERDRLCRQPQTGRVWSLLQSAVRGNVKQTEASRTSVIPRLLRLPSRLPLALLAQRPHPLYSKSTQLGPEFLSSMESWGLVLEDELRIWNANQTLAPPPHLCDLSIT